MSALDISTIVDFYLCQSAEFLIMAHEWHEDAENQEVSLRVLESEFRSVYSRIVDSLAVSFRDYCFLAAFGEARHAARMSNGYVPEDLPQECDRSTACDRAMEYEPQRNWEALFKVFNDNDWSSSYGGRAWAQIARAIRLFDLNWVVFVDHVVDLKHNGGSLFDKHYPLRATGIHMDMSEHAIGSFLNYKRDNNLIEAGLDEFAQYASAEVLGLVRTVARVFGNIQFPNKPSESAIEGDRPEYEGIEWGSREFSENWEYASAYTCDRCGDSLNEDDVYTSEGGYSYCVDCYNHLYHMCNECEGEFDRDSMVDTPDGEMCEDCAGEKFHKCEYCEEYIPEGDEHTTEDEIILCGHCYNNKTGECEHCGKVFYDEEWYLTDGLCEECRDLEWRPCEVCGKTLCTEGHDGHFTCSEVCQQAVYGYLPEQLPLPLAY